MNTIHLYISFQEIPNILQLKRQKITEDHNLQGCVILLPEW